MADFPSDVRSILSRVMDTAPSDLKLMAQRLHDHAVEERVAPAEVTANLAQLGYAGIAEFCADAGIADHVAERWARFGISTEMNLVLKLLIRQRQRFADATEEFEKHTHLGLPEFMKSRDII